MRVLVVSGSRAAMPDPVYPLGAAIVATTARRAGHEVAWFDALHHADADAALAETVRAFAPEAILLSIRNIDNAAFPSVERHFEDHRSLAAVCRRESGAPLVLGGSGFSLMPEAFLADLCADFGVVGEGETAVPALLDALASKRTWPRLSSRGGPLAPPFLAPDRDLFDARWYYERGGTANVQGKRGCELRCVYCTYPVLEGACVRAVEPGLVVDEMEALARSGMRHVFVVDSVFNRPEAHAAAVCDEILRRGLDISFTGYFVPQGRLQELPALLKRAGCQAAELGTDSLNDEVLTRLRKGFTAGEALDFSRRLAEADIKQCHNLVFGGPGETEATMEESVARMDAIDPAAVIATIGLRVYPGTDLAAERRAGSGSSLEPVFFIEEAVEGTVVERVAAWVKDRRGWICPGLGQRYNPRYLARLRKRHKGPLWSLF
ncbi:MAG: cobalamin-dependent protein [Deltaproteobacteria bacterium]|nr:cobalamin-dependent protein [Deltaproteobacteria bacterium]